MERRIFVYRVLAIILFAIGILLVSKGITGFVNIDSPMTFIIQFGFGAVSLGFGSALLGKIRDLVIEEDMKNVMC